MSVSRATPPVRLLARNVRDERRTAGVAHFRKKVGGQDRALPHIGRRSRSSRGQPITAGVADELRAAQAISSRQGEQRTA
jgi:hypothetical protein